MRTPTPCSTSATLPWLDQLLSPVVGEWRLREVVGDAVRILNEKGFAFRPALTARQMVDTAATKAIVFDPQPAR